MQDLIAKLKDKAIHVVGVTGAEGSSILRFLVKHGIPDITAHDFSEEFSLEKNFKLWHKGLSPSERGKQYQQFKNDLASVKLNLGTDYLSDIQSADMVFVPQSWRLYPKENAPLEKIAGKTDFYSLTRLYLDFAPAKIIAVTGTVGKGSTANIIFRLLKESLPADRRAYFAGNDTWMSQLADKLDEMSSKDILILEISHRQLQDGFTRAPYMTVITNLYPNHLDEVSWEDYVRLKLELVNRQKASDIAVLNYDIPRLRLKDKLKSSVIYFSGKDIKMNTKSIQNIYSKIKDTKSAHYLINLLAGLTAVELLGLNTEELLAHIPKVISLPARLELLLSSGGINIYDDIKSTTPWATLAAITKLGANTILICGGKTKSIDYKEFADRIRTGVKFVVLLKSEMSNILNKLLPNELYEETDDLSRAVDIAYKKAVSGDNILVSPAAGFFYRDFIKGKNSLRKLAISLLPKEQV